VFLIIAKLTFGLLIPDPRRRDSLIPDPRRRDGLITDGLFADFHGFSVHNSIVTSVPVTQTTLVHGDHSIVAQSG
jgi:hypothetical protein